MISTTRASIGTPPPHLRMLTIRVPAPLRQCAIHSCRSMSLNQYTTDETALLTRTIRYLQTKKGWWRTSSIMLPVGKSLHTLLCFSLCCYTRATSNRENRYKYHKADFDSMRTKYHTGRMAGKGKPMWTNQKKIAAIKKRRYVYAIPQYSRRQRLFNIGEHLISTASNRVKAGVRKPVRDFEKLIATEDNASLLSKTSQHEMETKHCICHTSSFFETRTHTCNISVSDSYLFTQPSNVLLCQIHNVISNIVSTNQILDNCTQHSRIYYA